MAAAEASARRALRLHAYLHPSRNSPHFFELLRTGEGFKIDRARQLVPVDLTKQSAARQAPDARALASSHHRRGKEGARDYLSTLSTSRLIAHSLPQVRRTHARTIMHRDGSAVNAYTSKYKGRSSRHARSLPHHASPSASPSSSASSSSHSLARHARARITLGPVDGSSFSIASSYAPSRAACSDKLICQSLA